MMPLLSALERCTWLTEQAGEPVTLYPIVRAWKLIRSGAATYWRIVLISTEFGWTGIARLTRGGALKLGEREFVLSARTQGAST